ncbi:MAG: stage II sporulation protein R [Lachnospiraceae bacterium]|nr:stage II sporulation protein R [Lachnospiraceae bacterium]
MTYKKLIRITFCFILFLIILCKIAEQYETVLSKDLSKSVIRFHVRANSDSINDQLLKYRVRDNVIESLKPLLKDCTSYNDAYETINKNLPVLDAVALKTIESFGYSYNVTSSLSAEKFPDKIYGGIKFPGGTYTSYIIEIGSGSGHNWWCCLYPPLCFINETTATFPEPSTNKLKYKLSKKEYKYVSNCKKRKHRYSSRRSKLKYRFKYLKFFN